MIKKHVPNFHVRIEYDVRRCIQYLQSDLFEMTVLLFYWFTIFY